MKEMKITVKAQVFPAHEKVDFIWKAALFFRLTELGEQSCRTDPVPCLSGKRWLWVSPRG